MEVVILISLGWLAKAFVDRKKVALSDPLAEVMSKLLETAVHAFRLYHGSSGMTNIRDAQKLYDRAIRAAARVAKAKGMDPGDAVLQLSNRAESLGPIIPRPGKDI